MSGKPIALITLIVAVAVLGALYVAFQRSQPTVPPPQPAISDRATSAAPATPPVAPTAQAPSTPSVPSTAASPPTTAAQAPAAQAPAAAASAGPQPTVLRLAIDEIKPGVAVAPLKATQGESLKIVVTTDKAGQVEIHGYNRHIDVKPGVESAFEFRAEYAGRFPIHLHTNDGGHFELTAIEIQPK